jgi:hypothetical protein
VHSPYLLMARLEMAQAMHNLIYLLMSCWNFGLNVSIEDKISQWNTYIFHRCGIFEQYLRVSHYGMLLDDHAK